MDRMNNAFIKPLLAFGNGGIWLAYFSSTQCSILLGNILKVIGILTGVASLIFLIVINRHRSQIKAIDEARAETRLCQACRLGKPPEVCPISEQHRPDFCPKEKEKKRLMKSRFTKSFFRRMLSSETTTK